MDLSGITEKLVESPFVILVSALLLIMTVLGTHFATSADLDEINDDVKQVQQDIRPLEERVTNLETDVNLIDKKVNKDMKDVDRRLKDASEKREELENQYHNIEVRLERVDGNQDLTNEKLEHIKALFERRLGDE